MTENASITPAKVILEETMAEIRKVFAFGAADKDHAKVAELLIDLPVRLESASDMSGFPVEEMETIRHWAESARKNRDANETERIPFDILYPWGTKANDKNRLEQLFDRVYPQQS